MRRRDFIILVAGAMGGWPSAARAQQKAMPVIGYLNGTSPEANAPQLAAFRQGLSETGWVEGQNLAIEYRWAEGHSDRLPALAADLVSRKVDVIAAASTAPAQAAKTATATVPIVFSSDDPVGLGLVASLARPGGNLTGASSLDLSPKRIEMISELVPQAKVIALLVNPNNPIAESLIRSVQEASRTKGVQLHVLKASTETEIDAAFATLMQTHAGALVLSSDGLFNSRLDKLVALASRHAIPAIYHWREFPAAGGLISYGPSRVGIYHELGIYVGKILKGAPSPPICRSSSRLGSSWSSISTPPKRSASPCRRRSSPAPTRSSSEPPRTDAPLGRRDDGGARPPRSRNRCR
jgi:putative ABC transport system substrate-binding protein